MCDAWIIRAHIVQSLASLFGAPRLSEPVFPSEIYKFDSLVRAHQLFDQGKNADQGSSAQHLVHRISIPFSGTFIV